MYGMNDLRRSRSAQRSEASRTGRRLARRLGLVGLSAALVLGACGGDDGEEQLSGLVRDPAPQVDEVALPSLSVPGEEVAFRAEPDGLQVVYWGFTNCPDVCPTTMADLAVALRRLDPEQAERVDVVMATVDPARDLDVLDSYVTSFVPDATALGTPDEALLEEAAAPFGASWEIRTLDDGTIEVDHSPFLYVVDDEGRLVLAWQFGVSAETMADDLSILLERDTA